MQGTVRCRDASRSDCAEDNDLDASILPSAHVAFKVSRILAPAVALAACRGGSSGTTGIVKVNTPSTTGSDTTPKASVSEIQASRFLTQASMGASRIAISEVVSKGYEAWIDNQFAIPRRQSLCAALIERGESKAGNDNSIGGYDASVWKSLIIEPDQLRQRIAVALNDFLVMSMSGLDFLWMQFACAGYLDILMNNAFGNYRDLLEQITLNPGMARYLSLLGNKKADRVTGSAPDENYAREFMQLFSIGLYELNMDGSVKTSNGQPISTYSQNDVSQLARIFTGLIIGNEDRRKYNYAVDPLIMEPTINESGSSTVLGRTFSGGGMIALKNVIDHIFSHANVPPFISKQLIQRLVTSNPSPAYVERVAKIFADNGRGVRGDMRAVIKAILLDTEARDEAGLTSNVFGRLRSPVQRLTAWARAFQATSPSDAWAIGNTSSAASGIGQSTGHSPSVFNFFRPGYTPPGSEISSRGMVAPEFQIANEQSVISYVNFMYKAVGEGIDDVKSDYAPLISKSSDTMSLVAEVNLLLAAGQLSMTTIAAIQRAVDSAASSVAKVNIAVLLTLVAPEFLVTR